MHQVESCWRMSVRFDRSRHHFGNVDLRGDLTFGTTSFEESQTWIPSDVELNEEEGLLLCFVNIDFQGRAIPKSYRCG